MYVYFGHHRCATQWVNSIIKATCRDLKLQFEQSASYGQVPDALEEIDFFAHINADLRIARQLDGIDYKAFHVIRDPRDILISSYYSDKYSHPVYSQEFLQFRAKLNLVGFDEGLRLELDRRRAEFEALETWDYHNPRVYETRFEILTADPCNEFIRIFEFLGLPMPKTGREVWMSFTRIVLARLVRGLHIQINAVTLPPLWLRLILWRNSFSRLAGRRRGRENARHHYRKGVPGDWRSYLQGEHKDLFKKQWGQLLIDLGYEKDWDW